MNIYTLCFLDNIFEMKFQSHIQKSYSTMNQLLSFGIIFGLISTIIENLITDHQISQLIIIQLIVIVYLFCQLFLVRKYQKLTLFAIFSNNVLVMIASIDMTEKDSNLAYFIGQNILCFHSIILLILDFKVAAVNNLMILIWRITMLNLKVEGLHFADILSAVLIQFVLMACLYIKCKAQRELFLLYMKDQSWEKQIPEIVSKPLFIFTFDNENLKFLSKLSVPMEFLKEIENPLQHLLRHTYYLGNTLELYIYRKFRSYDSETSEKTEILRVKYKKESKIIKFTIFKLNIINMIITVEDEDLNISILKQTFQHKVDNWKRIMKQQLLNQTRLMSKILKTKDKIKLQKIFIQYSQLILIEKSEKRFIQTVDLTKLLSGIIREFRMRTIKLITNQPLNLQTQKSKILILLMEITKQLLKQNKLILIQLGRAEQSIVMVIKQADHIQTKYKSKIIQQIQNELIQQITQGNQGIVFCYYLEITIKFYDSPQISFK